MAYRDLSQAEMISLGDALLEPKTHARLSTEPLLAPLLTKLAQIQVALKSYIVGEGNASAEIQKLTASLNALDGTHDRKMRGTFYALKATIEGSDDPATVAAAQEALQLIFPDGLSVTTASYQAEGGRAQLIENILCDDIEALLASLSLHGDSASTWLQQAIDAAKQLASLDTERDRLANAPPTSSRSGLQDLSFQWVNLIKSFDRLAPLSNLSPDDIRAAFGPLRDAAKAAKKK